MKSLKPYYPIFKFVATFALLYIGFSILYYFFLDVNWSSQWYPDPVTAQIAYQTQELLVLLGYNAQTLNSINHPSVLVFIDESILFRVIEGCNAISVMILYTAFVVAFSRGFKKTILFILFGILFIYCVNLIRLVILGIIFYSYSDYSDVAHDIVFPSVIYGAVVLLWIFWIKDIKTDRVEKS